MKSAYQEHYNGSNRTTALISILYSFHQQQLIHPPFQWPRCNLYILLWANKWWWWRWYICETSGMLWIVEGTNDCSNISAWRRAQ